MTPEQTSLLNDRLRKAFVNEDFGEASSLLDANPYAAQMEDRKSILRQGALAGWLSMTAGQSIPPTDPRWQGVKDGVMRGYFKQEDAKDTTDDDLYRLIGDDMRTQDEAVNLAADAAMMGQDFTAAAAQFAATLAGKPTRGRRDAYMKGMQAAYNDIAERLAPHRDLIQRQSITIKSNLGSEADGFSFKDVINEVIKVPEQDQKLVIAAITKNMAALPSEDMGQAMKMFAKAAREAEALGAALESGLVQVQEMLTVPAPNDPAAREALRQSQQGDRRYYMLANLLRRMSFEEGAPIESKNYFANAAIQAAGMVPLTATAFHPVGWGVMTSQLREDGATELLQANPAMTFEQADTISLSSAPLRAAIEVVSDRLMFGKLPAFERLMKSKILSPASFMSRLGLRVGVGTAVETAEEVAQKWTLYAGQEMATRLSKDVPDVDWQRVMSEMAQIPGEVAGPAFLLSLVGGGGATINDIMQGRALVQNEQLIVAAGASPELAAEIKKAADAGDMKAAERLLARMVRPAPADAATVEQRQEAARLYAAQVAPQEEAAAQEMEATGIAIRTSAGGWLMEAGGNAVEFSTHRQAMDAARAAIAAQKMQVDEKTFAAFSAYSETLGENQRMVISPEARTLLDEEAAALAVQDQTQLQEIYRRQALASEEAGREVGLGELRAMGDSYTEFLDGVKFYTSRIYAGARAVDMVEEKAETDLRRWIDAGRTTLANFRAMIRAVEQATRDSYLKDDSDGAVYEAYSDLARLWATGTRGSKAAAAVRGESISRQRQARRRIGTLASNESPQVRGMVALLQQTIEFFRQVLGRVALLNKARREGSLGIMETFLNESLGMTEQTAHNQAVQAEVEQMAGEGIAPPRTYSITSPELRARMAQLPDETTLGELGLTEGFHASNADAVTPNYGARASRQGRRGQYVGFYLGPNAAEVQQYGKNVTTFPLRASAKALILRKPGQGERITPQQAQQWRDQGFSVIVAPAIIPSRIEITVMDESVWNDTQVPPRTYSIQPAAQSAEMDREYLEAVETGDMAKAQDMVDKSAKEAGFNKYYRAGMTKREGIIPWASFSPERWVAENYQSNPGYGGPILREVFVKPLHVLNADGTSYIDHSNRHHPFRWEIDDAVSDEIVEAGYDAIIYTDAFPSGATTIVFTPNITADQIKSADPVTYDDAGKVIPLSRRFTPSIATPKTFSVQLSDQLDRLAAALDQQTKARPEARRTMMRRAMDKLAELRKDKLNWRLDVMREGLDSLAARERSIASLDRERKFRKRSRQRELRDAGIAQLAPATIAAYEQDLATLEDHPLVSAMLNDHGKLMSKATAQAQGKLKTDGTGNAGDYAGAPWLPPKWYAKSGGIMPDVMAQNLYEDGLISEPTPDALWAALGNVIASTRTTNDAIRAARQAVAKVERDAQTQASSETANWYAEQVARIPTGHEKMMAAIRTLDAILSVMPPEVRARVGGFVKLAGLKSNETRLAYLENRIEKLGAELEKYFQKELTDQAETLFARFGSKTDTGKRVGKLISTATEQVDYAREAFGMNDEETQQAAGGIEKTIEGSEDADEIANALAKLGMLNLFGNWQEKDAAAMDTAITWLEQTIASGAMQKAVIDEARKNYVKSMIEAGRSSILQGTDGALIDAENASNVTSSKSWASAVQLLKGFVDSALFTTAQQLERIFGAGSAILEEFGERILTAANLSTDIKRGVEARRRELMKQIYGSGLLSLDPVRGLAKLQKVKKSGVMQTVDRRTETVRLDVETLQKLADKTIKPEALGLTQPQVDDALERWAAAGDRVRGVDVEKVTNPGRSVERQMSEMQGLQWWLWWQQADSRKTMERDGWDADSIGQLEAFLSTEAKQIGEWMLAEYQRAGKELIDPVYRRLFFAPLPAVRNYSPIVRAVSGDTSVSGPDAEQFSSGLSASFTGARNPRANAPLRQTDAIMAFMAHVEHAAHWAAFAELVRDMKSILASRDVQNAIEAKIGGYASKNLKARIASIENMGNRSAWDLHALNTIWKRLMQYRAFRGLAFRLSPIVKQTSALLNPLLADVPATAYASGLAKLMTNPAKFARDTAAMWNGDNIRRRIEGGFSPEARIAMQGAGVNGSTLIALMQKGLTPMAWTDAAWSAAGAAIAFDYYRAREIANGANEALADKNATRAVERMLATSAQPTDGVNRSLLENSNNPFLRSMWMFASESRKTLAIEVMAMRRLMSGKSKNKALDAQRIVVAHVVSAGVTQLMSGFLAWLMGDEEDREREWSANQWAAALALGPINGLFVLGDAASMTVRRVLGLRVFQNANPVIEIADNAYRGVVNLDDLASDDPEEFMNQLDRLSSAVTGAAMALFGPQAAAIDVIGGNAARQARDVWERVNE